MRLSETCVDVAVDVDVIDTPKGCSLGHLERESQIQTGANSEDSLSLRTQMNQEWT